MIAKLVDWLSRLLDKVMSSVIGAVPTLDSDGGICDTMGSVGGVINSVTWLVPAPALATALGMILVTLVPILLIQITRLIASFLTGGGGSTS